MLCGVCRCELGERKSVWVSGVWCEWGVCVCSAGMSVGEGVWADKIILKS